MRQKRRMSRGVGEDSLARKTPELPLARRTDALADTGRAFGLRPGPARQITETHGGHVYVYVYAVKERAADAPDVALNLQKRAATLARRVIPEAVGTGVHSGREHEGSRKGQGHSRATDSHLLVF